VTIDSDARADQLISPDVGVVHRVDAGMVAYDHPRLATVYAQVCDTVPVLGAISSARAGGMAADPGHARRAAIGEAIERYSASYIPTSRLRTAPVEQLTDRPVAAPDWLVRGDPHGPVRWVPGHRLNPRGPAEPAWVAVSRAFLSGADEVGQVAIPTSTGLACHPDPWQALRAGLLEVVERDAFMTSWLTRSVATPVHSARRWRGAAGNELRFDRAVECYQLYLLDSPLHVPVALGVAYGGEGQPPVALGAAASLDPVEAGRKALIEAHQTFAWASHMLAQGQAAPADPAQIDDLDEHVAYYLDPVRLSAFDFLRETRAAPVTIDLDRPAPAIAPERACRQLVEHAAAAGYDCFAVDVTAPEVRAAGLWVIRAVIPELYPLLVGTTTAPAHPMISRAEIAARDPHPFP
jgi:ribosomal protein S12 methylthiotransferase accessory factor